MRVGVPSSELKKWFDGTEIIATDEGEAVGIAAGYYLATGEIPIVFMGANGFANALEPLTSLIIPYKIPIKCVVGLGREEEWHKIMSQEVGKIMHQLSKYDSRIDFEQIVG